MTNHGMDPDLARKLATAAKNAKDWPAERDRLVREAKAQGAGLREIARHAGLAHTSVLSILRKAPKK